MDAFNFMLRVSIFGLTELIIVEADNLLPLTSYVQQKSIGQ